MLNISIKNLGNIFIFLVLYLLLFSKKNEMNFFIGSAPTSLLIMAIRDPTLNDDELHTRMVTLRDSSTTKHIELMGFD
jgi:hypothetical protein